MQLVLLNFALLGALLQRCLFKRAGSFNDVPESPAPETVALSIKPTRNCAPQIGERERSAGRILNCRRGTGSEINDPAA